MANQDENNSICSKEYLLFAILIRVLHDFLACWVVLSIVHWIRRGRINVILGIKRNKHSIVNLKTTVETEYDHEKQKLYEKDRLAIPTRVDLERQHSITKAVNHINKYQMKSTTKSKKGNFRKMLSL